MIGRGVFRKCLPGFSCEPIDNWAGVATFTYRVTDGELYSETDATVTIALTNYPPETLGTTDDIYIETGTSMFLVPSGLTPAVAPEPDDTVVTDNMRDDVYEPDDDDYGLVIEDLPQHGALTYFDDIDGDFQPDGGFIYTANFGYAGPDSFSYQAVDAVIPATGVSGPVTVNIEVLPKVDIDTDSDNDDDVDRSPGEDLIETYPGKRIFINSDDDDENGEPDTDDVNPLTNPDNDLAEAILDFELSSYGDFEGHKLVLEYPGQTKIWGSGTKDVLSEPVYDPEAQTYTWTIDSSWTEAPPLPTSVFVEGMAVGTSWLTWTLQSPDGTALATDNVAFRVENIVWPLPQQKYSDWQLRNTSDWNGIKLEPAWYIDKALVDYINAPGEQGSIETIHPDMEIAGVPAASVEGSPSSTYGPTEVGGTYPDGFEMEFDYSFETSRNPSTGYVQADVWDDGVLRKKLSFVGNSGIKFGAYQTTGKPVEAAILDVKSMVGEGGGLEAFDPAREAGIDDAGMVTIQIAPPNPETYEPEPVNKLMSGIIYGGDYREMADNPRHLLVPPENPADAAEYYTTLLNNYNRANAHMKIDVSRVNSTVYEVDIYLDGGSVPCYSDYVAMSGPIGPLAVQTHWGSGVEFSNMSIIKKQS